MRIQTNLIMGDRYQFDFGACKPSRGFAQVDTGQDASYYGTWANPWKLQVVSFVEGDLTVQTADSEAEFVDLLKRIQAFNQELGYSFGIDPMLSEAIEARFRELGLGELLH